MSIIKKYKDVEEQQPLALIPEQAMEVFDLLVEGKTPFDIKLEKHYDQVLVERFVDKVKEIFDMTERIVKGQAYLQREILGEQTFDDDGNPLPREVIQEEQLAPVPNTIGELIETSLLLIGKDYSVADDPIFLVDNLEDVVPHVTEIITKQITLSNQSGEEATFDWWKSKVTGG